MTGRYAPMAVSAQILPFHRSLSVFLSVDVAKNMDRIHIHIYILVNQYCLSICIRLFVHFCALSVGVTGITYISNKSVVFWVTTVFYHFMFGRCLVCRTVL